MAKYVLVKDGVVINAIEWDGETPYKPGKGVKVVRSEDAKIGEEFSEVAE